MEKFWNVIHFFAYKFLNKLYILFIKCVTPTYQTKWAKKHFEKMGKDPVKELTFALTDKRFGQSSYYAYGIMYLIPFVFLCLLEIFYSLLFKNGEFPPFEVFICVVMINALIPWLIQYFLLMRHDKYIKYFRQFEKQPHEWKVKWAWISAGVILFPFLVLAGVLYSMLPK